ncbi:hypothetical protein HYV70_03805 [Candidatus Uhrbacteria bacterium]|nr:hypothetical protein [Candidatus Uhrbacteria bacterium]
MSEQRGEFDAMRLWKSATEADRDQDPFLEKFEPEPPLEVNRGRAVFELPEGITAKDVFVEFYDDSGLRLGRQNASEGARFVSGINVLEVKIRDGNVYIRGRKNSEICFIPSANRITVLELRFPKMNGTQDDPKPDSEDPNVKILR